MVGALKMAYAPTMASPITKHISFNELIQHQTSGHLEAITNQIRKVDRRLVKHYKNVSFVTGEDYEACKKKYANKRNKQAFDKIHISELAWNAFLTFWPRIQELEETKRQLKGKLPSLIASAVYSEGSMKRRGLVKGHTGIFCVDIDKTDVEKIWDLIISDQFVVSAFVSPSGRGVKVFYYSDYDFSYITDWRQDDVHKAGYSQILEHIEGRLNEFNIKADVSCSNINRICYICHDDRPYFNPGALPFQLDNERITAAQEAARKKSGSELPQLPPELLYEPDEALQIAKKNLEDREKEGKLQPYHIARYPYCFAFACEANRYGVPREVTIEYHAANFPISQERGFTGVHGAYDSFPEEHGTKGRHVSNIASLAAEVINKKDASRVNDFFSEILEEIKVNKDLALIAPTGSGKSYAFVNNVKKIQQAFPGKKIRLVQHTNALTLQTADEYGLNYLIGELSGEDKHIAANQDFIVTNYDMLKHSIPEGASWEDVIIIVDEWQEMATGDYRSATIDVWNISRMCHRRIWLSATPPMFFDLQDFHYLKLDIPKKNRVNITKLEYFDKQIHSLLPTIEKNICPGKILVAYTSRKAAKHLRKKLKKEGYTVAEINASEKQKKNPDTELLINERMLPNVDVVLVTKLIGAGINIYNENVHKVIYCDPAGNANKPDPDDFIQFVARFRKIAALEVIHMYRKRDGFNLGDISRNISEKIDEHEKHLQATRGLRDWISEFNKLIPNRYITKRLRQIQDELKAIMHNRFSDKFETNFLQIWRSEYSSYISSLCTDDYFNAILSNNENFSVVAEESVCSEEDEELSEIIETAKDKEKKADTELYKYLQDTISYGVALEACYHQCDDLGIKQMIQKYGKIFIPPDISEGVVNFIADNAETFQHTSYQPVIYWMQLQRVEFDHSEITAFIQQLSRQHDEEQEYIYFSEGAFKKACSKIETVKLVRLADKKETAIKLNEYENDAVKVACYRGFIDEIRKRKGRKLTREKIEEIYSNQWGKRPAMVRQGKDNTSMIRFKELFDYRIVREGKGENVRVFYVPVERNNVHKIRTQLGIDIDDWIRRTYLKVNFLQMEKAYEMQL